MPYLSELVLHNIGQHILDVESCGTNLLRNEARGGHTRCGIYLQHTDLSFLTDDIVDADNTVTVEDYRRYDS